MVYLVETKLRLVPLINFILNQNKHGRFFKINSRWFSIKTDFDKCEWKIIKQNVFVFVIFLHCRNPTRASRIFIIHHHSIVIFSRHFFKNWKEIQRHKISRTQFSISGIWLVWVYSSTLCFLVLSWTNSSKFAHLWHRPQSKWNSQRPTSSFW